MRKKVFILISIVLVLFVFKSFYEDSIVEHKLNEICDLIQIGDSYGHVLQVTSMALKSEEQAYVSEYTDGIYEYIYSNYPIKSIFYPQEYVCTAKFSNSIVIEKFVKFID